MVERRVWIKPDSELQTDWMIHAECRGMATATFFSDDHAGCEAQESAARRICSGCSVRAECLDYAIEAPMDYGVWGGLTWAERRRLAQARRSGRHFAKPPSP
jgi:WhiB family redox-sensing transcriptional regulator